MSFSLLAWCMLLSCLHVASVSSRFLYCSGQTGRVSKDLWDELRQIYQTDTVGRTFGIVVDPRSDSFEHFHGVLHNEVMVDLNAAVDDCVFGVIAMIMLTLPMVDQLDGHEKARQFLKLAEDLYFRFSDMLSLADWKVDMHQYNGHRLLLGFQKTDCAGTGLRIFIYNTTSDLTKRPLRTGFGMMGAATHMHTYLKHSSCLTDDPDEADLFFIPAYHGDQYDEMLEHRVQSDPLGTFPYLARRRGADHVVVVSANLPSWSHLEPLRNAAFLTVESYQVGGSSSSGEMEDMIPRWYSPWKDIMIPGYIDRWRIEAMRSFNKPTHERGYIMVFHGNHPGTHKLYITHKATIRSTILETFSHIPDCSVGGPVQDFFDRMGRSHFCLVPRGSSAWTIHLYESFFFGCIPVILSDEYEMPFQEVIDWPSLSVKWPMDRIGMELLHYLRAIPLQRVAEMKRNLEDAACFFDFHRGWGPSPSNSSGWTQWCAECAALSSDCSYSGHGNGKSLSACQASCNEEPRCNLVNFRSANAQEDEVEGDCVMRFCNDQTQPSVTAADVSWEVWISLNASAHHCSPFAATIRSLERRVQQRPFTHGPHWF